MHAVSRIKPFRPLPRTCPYGKPPPAPVAGPAAAPPPGAAHGAHMHCVWVGRRWRCGGKKRRQRAVKKQAGGDAHSRGEGGAAAAPGDEKQSFYTRSMLHADAPARRQVEQQQREGRGHLAPGHKDSARERLSPCRMRDAGQRTRSRHESWVLATAWGARTGAGCAPTSTGRGVNGAVCRGCFISR